MGGRVRRLLVLTALGLTGWRGAAAAPVLREREGQRPALKLRGSPGTAFPPVEVFLTAELVKGDDRHPDFYCPEVEWDFADGSRSVHQENCEPFGPEAVVERRFTRRHAFASPGEYLVTVTLRRAERVLARAATRILVQGGVWSSGDPYSAERR